jgi:hypothetical protein
MPTDTTPARDVEALAAAWIAALLASPERAEGTIPAPGRQQPDDDTAVRQAHESATVRRTRRKRAA